MFKKSIFLLLVMSFCLTSRVHGETIVWVSDNKADNTDEDWINLLADEGYTMNLDFRNEEGRDLDALELQVLNAADLIIISRDTDSTSYAQGNEATVWNSISTPIILQVGHIVRSHRWGWLDTTGTANAFSMMEVVVPNHPIFEGVTLDASNQVNILTSVVTFAETSDPGNGTFLARTPDYAWIVEWEPGQEFYSGSGQYARERRLYFVAGGTEGSNVDGRYNFNDEGRIMFLNAVRYMIGGAISQGNAYGPSPSDGQTEMPRDGTVLSWTPGTFADKHNVYLGTDFNDVNNADAGSLLLLGPAQDANTYDPGRLELGQTYFWRVDEVNAPSDPGIFKGTVWSFTVEAVGYPIPGENITVTASSEGVNEIPENTINGSGLVDNLHSTILEDMWLSAAGEPAPAWIQYDFDKVYKLHEMLVWNYNGQSFLTIAGINDVIVEYSSDGIEWMQIEGVTQFEQATGADGYAANTVVAFGGIPVKSVRITANSNWSGGFSDQYGLSEVRFLQIPVFAQQPEPEIGAMDIPLDVTLGWKAGREAAEHKVSISNNLQAVIADTANAVTVNQTNYGPLALDMGSMYYWRIDEVNNAEIYNIWQGDIWSFTTEEFRVVEDFEAYNEIPPEEAGSNLVYNTWTDGYGDQTNGSAIGYILGDSLETVNVHGGTQSAPLIYDNTTANYSEVQVNTAVLPIGPNWSIGSPQTLVIWFHGHPDNATTEQMYAKINNTKVTYPGEASDLIKPKWQQWNIDLPALGVNLSNIASLSIGFDRTGATGGSGTVFIDDIRLYNVAPPVPSEEIWIEAESADSITAPMANYYDPNASGGQYIGTTDEVGNSSTNPPAPDGTATYTFTVAGGTYKVSCRIIIPDGDSLWVRIPGATIPADIEINSSGWIRWSDPPDSDNWYWDDVFSADDNEDDTVLFILPAGSHTLEIGYREDGALIDAIVISSVD